MEDESFVKGASALNDESGADKPVRLTLISPLTSHAANPSESQKCMSACNTHAG